MTFLISCGKAKNGVHRTIFQGSGLVYHPEILGHLLLM